MNHFLTDDDYTAVIDRKAFEVAQQGDPNIRMRSEQMAVEEISSYVRTRYDAQKVFDARGEQRNRMIVMLCIDVALYHLLCALPGKMGMEIRKQRYERAIDYLRSLQAGKVALELPPLTDPSGADQSSMMLFGSEAPNKHYW